MKKGQLNKVNLLSYCHSDILYFCASSLQFSILLLVFNT